MTFDFRAHDGHTYHLDTEGGAVHVSPLDTQEQQEQPLEPSEEQSHG